MRATLPQTRVVGTQSTELVKPSLVLPPRAPDDLQRLLHRQPIHRPSAVLLLDRAPGLPFPRRDFPPPAVRRPHPDHQRQIPLVAEHVAAGDQRVAPQRARAVVQVILEELTGLANLGLLAALPPERRVQAVVKPVVQRQKPADVLPLLGLPLVVRQWHPRAGLALAIEQRQ